MAARLSLAAALPKLRHLTADEAARRLGVTLAELEEANRFALVPFADPDPEAPRMRPSPEQVAESRDRMPKRMAERQRKAEWQARRATDAD